MSYLANLPKSKWTDPDEQPGLKEDMVDIEYGIVESFGMKGVPEPTWVDITQLTMKATADSPARVMMSGFPDVFHPSQLLPFSSDGKYRENVADVSMDFDVAVDFLGVEKGSQYYAVLAIAGDSDSDFTLFAVPYLRVLSQATKTISLGTNLNAASAIGYYKSENWDTDSLIGYKLYFLSGSSKGLAVTVSANNNSSTDGTITYSESALTITQGDWFVILPNTNFCYLKDIFNNASSDINIGHVPGTLTLGMAGRVCVEKQTFSGVSSFTFSGLIPGEKYILEIALTQVGASAHHVITINGDTSSIYVVEAIVTTGGAPTYGTYVTAQGFPLTLGSYTSFVNYPAKFTIEFNTMFADSKKVVMNGYGGYTRNGGMAQFVGTCYYPGAANLSSIIYSTASGTLLGTAYLYKLV